MAEDLSTFEIKPDESDQVGTTAVVRTLSQLVGLSHNYLFPSSLPLLSAYSILAGQPCSGSHFQQCAVCKRAKAGKFSSTTLMALATAEPDTQLSDAVPMIFMSGLRLSARTHRQNDVTQVQDGAVTSSNYEEDKEYASTLQSMRKDSSVDEEEPEEVCLLPC